MTDRENELIRRYIYEVTKRVPKEQRSEIEMELQELFTDMMESLSLEEVFAKLGDPAEFAKKYREDKNYIISPEYYDNYIWVLKIVLACVWLGLLVSLIVNSVISYQNIPYEIVDFMFNIVFGSISAFGSVTLIFAVMEYFKIKVDLNQKKVWTSDMLNPIPDKKAKISRGDCIASIIFIILFSCLILFMPVRVGGIVIDGKDIEYIPMFNMQKWNLILPFILLSLAVSFIDEIIHLVTGTYCKLVMYSNIIANAIQIVLGVVILKVLPFWNPDFAQEIVSQFGSFEYKDHLLELWNTNVPSDILLAIIVFASVLEVATTVYKTFRYGVDSRHG